MSAAKHTPGPWMVAVISPSVLSEPFYVRGEGGTIAKIRGRAEAEANARLIAAAPELAEAALPFVGGVEGWLPGAGEVVNITVTKSQRLALLTALRAAGLLPEGE